MRASCPNASLSFAICLKSLNPSRAVLVPRFRANPDVAKLATPVFGDHRRTGWRAGFRGSLPPHRRRGVAISKPAPSEALATFDQLRWEFDGASPVIGRMQRDMRARLEAELNAVT